MSDQIDLKFTVVNHVAKRDELPDPTTVSLERRCVHMKALSLRNFYHFHIPDQKFQALICYDCMCRLRILKGTFFLASDPMMPNGK